MKIVNETYQMLVVIVPSGIDECLNYGTSTEVEFNSINDRITAHCESGSCVFRVSPESFSTGIVKYDHSSFGNVKATGQGTEDDPFVVQLKI